MQCSNNFKQIGIGFHNFHDVKNHLPAGSDSFVYANGAKTSSNHGCIFSADMYLLPYVERTAAWDEIYNTVPTNPGAMAFWGNASVAAALDGKFPVFLCPSDGITTLANPIAGDGAVTATTSRFSTRYCLGDGMWHCAADPAITSDTGGPLVHHRGVFHREVRKAFESITDGLSNTIGYSEGVCSTINNDRKIKSGITGGTGTSSPYNGTTAVPRRCLDNGLSADKSQLASSSGTCRGGILGDGRPTSGGFHTALPPNSPSCGYGAAGGGTGNWGVFSASSEHTGGVNVMLMDGAVRFITNSIDTGNLSGIQGGTSRTSPSGAGTYFNPGPSHYGVWGALGTPSAGEVAALP